VVVADDEGSPTDGVLEEVETEFFSVEEIGGVSFEASLPFPTSHWKATVTFWGG
jgi:hypothetical protein